VSTSLADSGSAEWYRRALEVLPGGVNSPVRAMRAIGRSPIFVDRGEGAELIDVDGNRFIDYVCSWGPLIHGHAHPVVLDAVASAAGKGTSFGAPTPAEVELAVEVTRRIEGVEMLRMTSSGTEATMTAVRLARAATGREHLLKFAGAYHGHLDPLLAQAGSGLATQGLPSSPGVPPAAAAGTVVVPWNDPDALRVAVEQSRDGRELAAIIAEPLPANMGLVPAREGFLELLREQADACGALLILDEVISGFRVARGGAQELTGVHGDLTILGKILGGGLPAAALGGRGDLMRLLAPAGEVYQAGTLSGNPVATAAGLAQLRLLDEAAYARVDAVSAEIQRLVTEALSKEGVAHRVQAAGNMFSVFFTDQEVRDFDDAKKQEAYRFTGFFHAMLAQGVYLPPSAFESWFVSTAHDERAVARIAAALPAAARAAAEAHA